MALAPGDTGEAVRQLQRRLGAAGFLPDAPVTPDVYCPITEQAVAAFQVDRGLTATGVADDDTVSALEEAWWSLGDRPLMLRSPNLRGDDVIELQRVLSRLGFDAGRIDGIFGARTSLAVGDFQLNAGLEVTNVCDDDTVRVLRRLSRMTGDGPGIAAVRDAEQAQLGQSLDGRRVAIGQFGGFSALSRPLAQSLRDRGALIIDADDSDAVAQAATVNLFGANVYIGLEASTERVARVTYYAVPAFESAGGKALARLIERHLRDVVPRMTVEGMRLPILRETKMPAVLITLGPTQQIVDRANRVAQAIFLAISAWSQ